MNKDIYNKIIGFSIIFLLFVVCIPSNVWAYDDTYSRDSYYYSTVTVDALDQIKTVINNSTNITGADIADIADGADINKTAIFIEYINNITKNKFSTVELSHLMEVFHEQNLQGYDFFYNYVTSPNSDYMSGATYKEVYDKGGLLKATVNSYIDLIEKYGKMSIDERINFVIVKDPTSENTRKILEKASLGKQLYIHEYTKDCIENMASIAEKISGRHEEFTTTVKDDADTLEKHMNEFNKKVLIADVMYNNSYYDAKFPSKDYVEVDEYLNDVTIVNKAIEDIDSIHTCLKGMIDKFTVSSKIVLGFVILFAFCAAIFSALAIVFGIISLVLPPAIPFAAVAAAIAVICLLLVAALSTITECYNVTIKEFGHLIERLEKMIPDHTPENPNHSLNLSFNETMEIGTNRPYKCVNISNTVIDGHCNNHLFSVYDNGVLNLTNCTIHNHNSGGIIKSLGYNAQIILTNCTFIDNMVALYDHNDPYGKWVETDNTPGGSCLFVENNKPLVNNGVNVVISGCNFTNNKAGYGGCIYLKNSNIDLHNVSFTNNEAGYGGVLYATDDSNCWILGNNTISNNNAIMHEGDYIFNIIGGRGGAIYLDHSKLINPTNDVNTHTIFKDNSAHFENNYESYPEYGGGAVYACNNSDVKLVETYFIGNNAKSLNDNCRFSNSGGAIRSEESSIHLYGGNEFNNNSADNGGAIYINNAGLELYDRYINSLNPLGNNSFNSNEAFNGGALYLSKPGPIKSSDGTIFNSNAATAHGGAIFVCNCTETNAIDLSTRIGECNFTKNTPDSIFHNESGHIILESSDKIVKLYNNSFISSHISDYSNCEADADIMKYMMNSIKRDADLMNSYEIPRVCHNIDEDLMMNQPLRNINSDNQLKIMVDRFFKEVNSINNQFKIMVDKFFKEVNSINKSA